MSWEGKDPKVAEGGEEHGGHRGRRWLSCFLVSHSGAVGVSPGAPRCGARSGADSLQGVCVPAEGWCLPPDAIGCRRASVPVPKALRVHLGALACAARGRAYPEPSRADLTAGNVPRGVTKRPLALAARGEPVRGVGSPAERGGGAGAPGFAAAPVEFNDSEILV